ncbi:MAG TPA: single-stranded DNA-binding protein [Candidatus Paceibacterota bacterium]
MYLNRATLIGNLTRDPETRALPSGAKVCSFSIATNRVWKDQQTGAKKEAVDYHNIVVFGRTAENCSTYLKKGQSVLIEGRIQTRSWDGPDGKKNYRTEIVADTVQFGPKAAGSGAPRAAEAAAAAPAAAAEAPAADSAPAIEYPQEEINPEDIPF